MNNRDGDTLVISVTCLTAHLSVNPPHRPVAKQQTLLISRSDQIGKRHPIELIWRGGDRLKMALQHLVADFVGEFKPLNQAITDLRIGGVALVADQTLAQAIDRIRKGREVEHPIRPLNQALPLPLKRLRPGAQTLPGCTGRIVLGSGETFRNQTPSTSL